MSNLPVDLTDRRVVVSVVVLLLGIMILNWRVFQPLRARHARQEIATEEAVYLPPDLGEMAGAAAARLKADGGDGNPGAVARAGIDGGGLRDPFRTRTDPPPPPVPARTAGSRSTARAPRPTCAAVMLGGSRPTALIGGQRYHPGDRVGAYRVERIDAGGAYLDGTDGRLFLPVGGNEDDTVHYPPIRGARTD
ncbi:MAG: hypothetical protein GY838_02440 [bacterium]|nr:hypothetical protein [bacterium]